MTYEEIRDCVQNPYWARQHYDEQPSRMANSFYIVRDSYLLQRMIHAPVGIYGMGGCGTHSYLKKDDSGNYTIAATDPNNIRWDCSGFVAYCCGWPVGIHGFATPWGNEDLWLSNHGFTEVTRSVNLSTGYGMKPGDVVIYNKGGTSGEGANGHTQIYVGNGCTIGARGSTAGHDYVGLEGGFASLSRNPYQKCFRPRGGPRLIRWEGN